MSISPFINIKNVLILITIIFLGLFAWKMNSIYNENIQLNKDIEVQTATISELNATLVFKSALVDEVQKRLAMLESMNLLRDERVATEKDKSKQYLNNIKTEADNIKQKTPELLDEFYATKYNSILECIQDTSAGKESKC